MPTLPSALTPNTKDEPDPLTSPFSALDTLLYALIIQFDELDVQCPASNAEPVDAAFTACNAPILLVPELLCTNLPILGIVAPSEKTDSLLVGLLVPIPTLPPINELLPIVFNNTFSAPDASYK